VALAPDAEVAAAVGSAEAPDAPSPPDPAPVPPTDPHTDPPPEDRTPESGALGPPPAPPTDPPAEALWLLQRSSAPSSSAASWVPFGDPHQRALEAAYQAGDRVVDLLLDGAECLADLKLHRLLGPGGVTAIRRRGTAKELAEAKERLAECRATVAAVDRTAEEFAAALKSTFAEWRRAVEQREGDTLAHLEQHTSEYRRALLDAHESAVQGLLAAGYEVGTERLEVPKEEVVRLTFKAPTERAFVVRRMGALPSDHLVTSVLASGFPGGRGPQRHYDEGTLLKWRDVPSGSMTPRKPEKAVGPPSEYYLAVALEALPGSHRSSWAFRFDKGRYAMAGVVRAEAEMPKVTPWRGDAFLWQLSFCTTNGGRLGTVAPGLLNHPPLKPGAMVLLSYDPASATLTCTVGSRRGVVLGTDLKGPVVPAFVLYRGDEVTVLHSPPVPAPVSKSPG